MDFDLNRMAERLRAAADRANDFKVTVSNFDLILSKAGHGASRSESVPFAAMFLREDDVLGQAIARLEQASPD